MHNYNTVSCILVQSDFQSRPNVNCPSRNDELIRVIPHKRSQSAESCTVGKIHDLR